MYTREQLQTYFESDECRDLAMTYVANLCIGKEIPDAEIAAWRGNVSAAKLVDSLARSVILGTYDSAGLIGDVEKLRAENIQLRNTIAMLS